MPDHLPDSPIGRLTPLAEARRDAAAFLGGGGSFDEHWIDHGRRVRRGILSALSAIRTWLEELVEQSSEGDREAMESFLRNLAKILRHVLTVATISLAHRLSETKSPYDPEGDPRAAVLLFDRMVANLLGPTGDSSRDTVAENGADAVELPFDERSLARAIVTAWRNATVGEGESRVQSEEPEVLHRRASRRLVRVLGESAGLVEGQAMVHAGAYERAIEALVEILRREVEEETSRTARCDPAR